MPKINLLKHQYQFAYDNKTRFLALVGGFSSGKTRALAVKTAILARLNVGYKGALFSPTVGLASSELMPTFEEVLEEMGIPFTFRASPLPKYTLHFGTGDTTILVRSIENWNRIRSDNLAFCAIDELDTVKPSIAQKAWRLILGRLRTGKVLQIAIATTPEGFGIVHQIFVKEATLGNRRYIKADTRDNPFIDKDFVQMLFDNYPPNLVQAYVSGEFVNLTSGQVYPNFDRTLNGTPDQLLRSDSIGLVVGMDFNKTRMAAVIGLVRPDNSIIIFDEVVNVLDTPAMIRELKGRYPDKHLTIYPDAAGDRGTTGNTDVNLLKQAGFSVVVNPSNPLVQDRVNTVNAALCNAQGYRRLKVNITNCPRLTEALEQQVYTEAGTPDKSTGLDHVLDALGYLCIGITPLRIATTARAGAALKPKAQRTATKQAVVFGR